MPVSSENISDALQRTGLAGRPVMVHSSLRSFGSLVGGTQAILDPFLDHGCTVMVPTFSHVYVIPPPEGQRLERNYPDDEAFDEPVRGRDMVYTCDSQEIDTPMGALPVALLAMEGRARGYHPLCSFSAVGPAAHDLVASQSPLDIYGPARELARMDGLVVLMGVGLTRVTALHYAEQLAGRELFRKWANGLDGQPIPVAVGGQAHGFHKLDPIVYPMETRIEVGSGLWRIFPAQTLLQQGSDAMRKDPMATHCAYEDCRPCNEATDEGPR